MTITVEIKNVYGTDKVYPICEQAKLLTRLTGNKTMTDSAIKTIKELGYTIEVKTKEL